MKQFQVLLISFALIAFIAACGGNASHSQDSGAATDQNTETQAQPQEEQGPEYTSAYICPMHCEGSGSDQPGTCPVCGMDYVVNENAAKDSDAHGHDHDGHSH
ncbi:MAG: heavy metal-binding domain-containing protein [Saprospiraceae bacterium]